MHQGAEPSPQVLPLHEKKKEKAEARFVATPLSLCQIKERSWGYDATKFCSCHELTC